MNVPSLDGAELTAADLVTPMLAIGVGGATGVGAPGPPGLLVGTSPVLAPVMSVPVLESSDTVVPLGGVPLAVAVLVRAEGAPAALGSMLTVKVTWY